MAEERITDYTIKVCTKTLGELIEKTDGFLATLKTINFDKVSYKENALLDSFMLIQGIRSMQECMMEITRYEISLGTFVVLSQMEDDV